MPTGYQSPIRSKLSTRNNQTHVGLEKYPLGWRPAAAHCEQSFQQGTSPTVLLRKQTRVLVKSFEAEQNSTYRHTRATDHVSAKAYLARLRVRDATPLFHPPEKLPQVPSPVAFDARPVAFGVPCQARPCSGVTAKNVLQSYYVPPQKERP